MSLMSTINKKEVLIMTHFNESCKNICCRENQCYACFLQDINWFELLYPQFSCTGKMCNPGFVLLFTLTFRSKKITYIWYCIGNAMVYETFYIKRNIRNCKGLEKHK